MVISAYASIPMQEIEGLPVLINGFFTAFHLQVSYSINTIPATFIVAYLILAVTNPTP